MTVGSSSNSTSQTTSKMMIKGCKDTNSSNNHNNNNIINNNNNRNLNNCHLNNNLNNAKSKDATRRRPSSSTANTLPFMYEMLQSLLREIDQSMSGRSTEEVVEQKREMFVSLLEDYSRRWSPTPQTFPHSNSSATNPKVSNLISSSTKCAGHALNHETNVHSGVSSSSSIYNRVHVPKLKTKEVATATTKSFPPNICDDLNNFRLVIMISSSSDTDYSSSDAEDNDGQVQPQFVSDLAVSQGDKHVETSELVVDKVPGSGMDEELDRDDDGEDFDGISVRTVEEDDLTDSDQTSTASTISSQLKKFSWADIVSKSSVGSPAGVIHHNKRLSGSNQLMMRPSFAMTTSPSSSSGRTPPGAPLRRRRSSIEGCFKSSMAQHIVGAEEPQPITNSSSSSSSAAAMSVSGASVKSLGGGKRSISRHQPPQKNQMRAHHYTLQPHLPNQLQPNGKRKGGGALGSNAGPDSPSSALSPSSAAALVHSVPFGLNMLRRGGRSVDELRCVIESIRDLLVRESHSNRNLNYLIVREISIVCIQFMTRYDHLQTSFWLSLTDLLLQLRQSGGDRVFLTLNEVPGSVDILLDRYMAFIGNIRSSVLCLLVISNINEILSVVLQQASTPHSTSSAVDQQWKPLSNRLCYFLTSSSALCAFKTAFDSALNMNFHDNIFRFAQSTIQLLSYRLLKLLLHDRPRLAGTMLKQPPPPPHQLSCTFYLNLKSSNIIPSLLQLTNSFLIMCQQQLFMPSEEFKFYCVHVLQLINEYALYDLERFQESFGSSRDGRSCSKSEQNKLRQLIYCLLPFANPHNINDDLEQQQAAIVRRNEDWQLMKELVLLIGFYVVGNPGNQLLMRTGHRPFILQQLCRLPIDFFVKSELSNCLFPTLIACCEDELNLKVVKEEISFKLLLKFLQNMTKSSGKTISNSGGNVGVNDSNSSSSSSSNDNNNHSACNNMSRFDPHIRIPNSLLNIFSNGLLDSNK